MSVDKELRKLASVSVSIMESERSDDHKAWLMKLMEKREERLISCTD